MKIKDDSEYPDWIWTMHLGRPLKSTEIEYGTREYWDTLEREQNKRMMRLQNVKHNPQMRVGQNEQFKMEYQERIKYRALASYYYEPGTDPNDSKYSGPHMKLWLKPQDDPEKIHPDAYARDNPTRFINSRSGAIGVPTEKRISQRMRGYRTLKGGFLPFKNQQSESTLTIPNESTEIN